jgi:enoyl-[acyl-carrier protein] reductase/trans-2-enoyl-CoA reductase (NAD+)
MIIAPRIKGFVCTTAHPYGAAHNIQQQVNYVRDKLPVVATYKSVLILGGTTGYGLSSAIVASFGCGAKVLNVGYANQARSGRTANVGLYNTAAWIQQATSQGLWAKAVMCDAFTNQAKRVVGDIVANEMPPLDLIIYSLAAPRRTHPTTGTLHNSVLKPIGQPYTSKNLNVDTGVVDEIVLQPASTQEIEDTIMVMGGQDWRMWCDALIDRGLVADNATTIAFSYIGPEITHAIYKDGTIGQAKIDLKKTADTLTQDYKDRGLKAYVSVNKALVTQASSAIPVVPLYISILYDIMKQLGNHEDCIMQMVRLLGQLRNGVNLDEQGYIRLDDWEMSPQVQQEVSKRWAIVDTYNLKELADFEGYKTEFVKLFGFGVDGVDYDADVDPVANDTNIIFDI